MQSSTEWTWNYFATAASSEQNSYLATIVAMYIDSVDWNTALSKELLTSTWGADLVSLSNAKAVVRELA